MKRLLWLGVGLAVGAIIVRKVSRKASQLTPSGIAGSLSESAGGLVESLRSFVDDVRDGMAERQEQIHHAFAEGQLYDDEFAAEPDDEQDSSQGRHSREGMR